MSWLIRMLTSSIGKKIVMALTGLFLITFLLVHLSGNFTLFAHDNGDKFNAYSKFMTTTPLIKILEIGLILGFLIHMIQGVTLYFQNKAARPSDYGLRKAQDNSKFSSRAMFLTGSITFVFLALHLRQFLVEHRVLGNESKTMFESVVEAFRMPGYAGFYVFAMIVLGVHLNHGFQSAFQTFGWSGKKYTPIIKAIGLLISILIPLGFSTMPIYFVMGGK